jgi:hypothetical protein
LFVVTAAARTYPKILFVNDSLGAQLYENEIAAGMIVPEPASTPSYDPAQVQETSDGLPLRALCDAAPSDQSSPDAIGLIQAPPALFSVPSHCGDGACSIDFIWACVITRSIGPHPAIHLIFGG